MEKTWQRQWDASRRQDNIRKILEVLKQSQLATENDSMQSMTDMATKFEEQVFQSAESSDKYLSKIATRLAKISAKIVAPQGQQQMVQNMQPAPLHIPPGHMPVSQLGGGPQMLSQQGGGQSGGNPMLRSNSPALYAGGSPGYSSVSRGFNAQNLGSANALPMGPAGGVPITALGMGGAPPGSFGLHPDQSQRQRPGSENYGNYQQTTNQNIVRGQQQQQRQQLAAQQLKNSMPPNMNPQQQQAWMEMRKREYMQRQQQQQIMQGNQAGAQKSNQQYAQQQYLMQQQQQGGGGNTQMLTPQQQQQQQQILLQQKQLQHLQRQTQMQQGGMQASSMVASSQQRPMAPGAPAAVVDPEQLWQNLQQLKAKFLEPLTNVYGQVNAQLASIANQGKPAHERSLKMLRSYADKMITTLQAQDRAQAVAMQRNFPKGLGHFEEQLVQLLSTWHKKAKPGVDSGKKAQEQQQEAMAREAQALQERQKMEQEVLRKRQQQQQEQLLKQQQQQQQQAQQRAQHHALQQSHQAAGQQQQLQQGPSGQQQQQQGGAPTKPAQQMILDQVLNAFASKANMTYQQFVKLVQTQPELRKRVALEVQKLQQRIAQQANAASLPQPTPLQTAPPLPAPKFNHFSPSPMPAQTPPLAESFRAPSPVEAYKPFSPFPDNFKAPTPPFQSATPPVPGKQLSASGASALTSPGVSVAGPMSPRLGSDGKPPTPGAAKSLAKQSVLKGAASGSNLTKLDVDVEDLPIALRSQVSSEAPRDNPLRALAKKVWLLSQSSHSQSTLEQAASEIDHLMQLTNQYALVPLGTDSKSAKPENLVANTRARLAGKGGGEAKRGRLGIKKAVVSVGLEGSEFDAGSSISDANSCVDFQHSGDEAGSEKGAKRARFGAQSALEGEIDDVNRFLIDTRVEITWEGTKDAEMEGKKGTAVLCTYNGDNVSLSPLRLLVPPSYPAVSPSVWHDYSAPNFSLPVAITARENFSAIVRRQVAPLSIGAMARCWDQSVREAVADLALSQGGGCFSNTVGVWMHCA